MFRGVGVEVLAGVAILAVVAVVLAMRAARALKTARLTIYEYQGGLRFQDGRIVAVVGPGTYYRLLPGTHFHVEDLRERNITLAGQEMLSADQLTLRASLTARVRITDIKAMALATEDPFGDLHTDLQIALRKAVQARTLEALLGARDEIGPEVLAAVRERAAKLGIELIGVEVRDIMLSGEAKRAYADIFRAKKEGEAALERARGETAALRSLANAARMLKDNPHLYQLRLLQTLSSPAGKGTTVVLNSAGGPLPAGSVLVEPSDPAPPEKQAE